MNRLKLLLSTTALLLTSGCFAPPLIPVNSQNYQVGQIIEATVGSPMIEQERQQVVVGDRWVGVANSSSGYEEKLASTKQELIYGGRIGTSLKIVYREYKDSFARTPFFQDLQYDLNESKEITFRNFKFLILEADNSKVKFKVISE